MRVESQIHHPFDPGRRHPNLRSAFYTVLVLLLSQVNGVGQAAGYPASSREAGAAQEPNEVAAEILAATRSAGTNQLWSIIESTYGSQTDTAAVATRLEGSATPAEKHALFRLLDSMGEDQATAFAFDLAIANPGKPLSRLGLAVLENRTVRRTLTANERKQLLELIRTSTGGQAASWARILARGGAANAEVVEATVKAFVRELERPTDRPGPLYDSFASADESRWNEFLRTLPYMNPDRVIPLLRTEGATNSDPAVRLWLTLARGRVGDRSVGPELQQVIENTNISTGTRYFALIAYGFALSADARPLLEKYRDDPTPGPPLIGTQPTRPLAGAARDMLYLLDHPDARRWLGGP